MLIRMTILAQAGAPPATAGGDQTWLVWGIVLLAIAAALFFVEVLLPTGGLLGFLSAAALVGGIFMLFRVNTTLGLVSSIVTLVAIPFLLLYALKLWPDTPFGRWVTLEEPDAAERDGPHAERSGRGGGVHEGDKAAAVAVGMRGRTLTDLRPVGTCLLNDRREECFAARGSMPRDTAVQVVRLEGNEIYVAAAEPSG